MACNCVNIEFGSYDRYISLPAPVHMRDYLKRNGQHPEIICLDACISEEVQQLWQKGIITTGCCCGHNKGPEYPFIGVVDADAPKMKSLGYEIQPGRENDFIPKTIKPL